MFKKIMLGNTYGYIVDDDNELKLKQITIDHLYSSIALSKYRYTILNSIEKLKFLQSNEHYVSPNFRGNNYLLLMFMHNGKKYCMAIERRKLSYHKNQIDMKNIQVIQIKMNVPEIIFRGTIFEGKIFQTKPNNKYVFLIQDCFYLIGNKMLEMEMSQKITHLDNIIKSHFNNIYCTNFEFKLNKLYKYEQLETLINNLPKLSIGTNGLIFYPKYSGLVNIYTENKNDKIKIDSEKLNNNIIEQKSYNIICNFVDFLKSRTYSYESGDKTKVLWLSRTLIPDVYDVVENIKNEKQGIAMIPNLKISQMCDDIIKDEPVQFICIFSNKFKKWIPIKSC